MTSEGQAPKWWLLGCFRVSFYDLVALTALVQASGGPTERSSASFGHGVGMSTTAKSAAMPWRTRRGVLCSSAWDSYHGKSTSLTSRWASHGCQVGRRRLDLLRHSRTPPRLSRCLRVFGQLQRAADTRSNEPRLVALESCDVVIFPAKRIEQ